MAGEFYSVNRFPGDGVTTQFEFAFDGGYISREHVKAYYLDAEGVQTNITVTPGMFLGDFTLNLGIAAPVGGEMVIYRDTPKAVPLLDFQQGARLTESNLDKIAQQAIFGVAEIYDAANAAGIVVAEVVTAAAEASAARDAAQAAEAGAEIAQAAALASSSAASASAGAAAASAASASASAVDANASEAAAGVSAASASASASAAAGSASAAATSASEAAASAASINPADLVHKSGTETITGLKTFTQVVTAPSFDGATSALTTQYTPPGGAPASNVDAYLDHLATKWVSPRDPQFGGVGDGVADDTLALQAWLNSGSKLLIWPAGYWRVTGAAAQSLSVTDYAFGDATLKACLTVPAGVTIITEGTATQLIVDAPVADTCAIAIAEDTGGSPSSHSQITTTIGRFILRANGANGRYGVVTPAKAGLLANKRPRYALDVHFAPPPGSDSSTISAYGWDRGIMLGDTVDARINYSGYGTYNPTAADAGQHQMTGMRVSSVTGAYGVSVRFQCANMRTFFDAGDGLEGFTVTQSEGQGCWTGVVTSNTVGEPGGFIDAVHINANKTGFSLLNRTSIQIGTVEAYRSDAYHDHGGVWDGLLVDTCGKVTVESLHVLHGTLLTKTGTSGVRAVGTTMKVNSWQFNSVQNAFALDNSPDCVTGRGVANSVDVLHKLTGASTLDYSADDVTIRAGTTAYFTTDGTVDKKRLRFPLNSGITVRTYQDLTIAAAGSTTVKPRETATSFDVVMSAGTGAFTYDLILDRTASVPGDVVRVKIFGSSSANPTLRICDNSTAAILSTFTGLGGTTRLIAEYRLNESGNWVERYVFTSTELSY